MPLLTAILAFLIGGAGRRGDRATTRSRPTATSSTAPGLNWFFNPTTDTFASTAAYNLSQTLLQTSTLVLTGLAVAFAFRCGMFNIGGQGQYFVGLYVAIWVGTVVGRDVEAAAHRDRDRRRDARAARSGPGSPAS